MSNQPNPSGDVGDLAAAKLRTVVPAAWGSLIAIFLSWILPRIPGEIGELLESALTSEPLAALVTALVILAWYTLWRRLERHIPPWLIRTVLGSSKTPTYSPVIEAK